jgi:hypothetical protein
MTRARAALAAALILAGLAACDGGPEQKPLPSGVVMHIDQGRIQRSTRQVYIRVDNHTKKSITITGASISSPRFDAVTWKGKESIPRGLQTDLDFTMPPTRCGHGAGVRVVLTYTYGDSDERESAGKAGDLYEEIGLLMDRDCAKNTLAEAANLRVGTPTVVGAGPTSVLHLPLTLTPTGKRDDVRFGGFESTPLFRQDVDSPVDVDQPISSTEPTRIVMEVVPARCDPHALAEDKVGRLFGMRIIAPGLPENTSFYLPFDHDQRVAFYDYFHTRCGA